jgi:hypothetical protein
MAIRYSTCTIIADYHFQVFGPDNEKIDLSGRTGKPYPVIVSEFML